MPVCDLSNPSVPLPEYLVVDASLLLVLRSGASHRHQADAKAFLSRVGIACLRKDLALSQPGFTPEERMRHYVAACNVLPKDAYIPAVAERLGVSDVATLDSDWRRAAQFTVYTC